ncbi:glycoside hydrolase family 88/105 protein [Halalkalibacter krulwichiae]|uniref:Unsaturated rhamnogalacturonyl hydrolase YteR n=1 Tax=Halalkalibacter krulwichiae TaxID=199441 RepID=A0A1X9M809_9BACI|nr:glycoside hydrolase family 105 protein [Halalkalibacter krulwichiae]ARK29546.1 Unsaturated rhamnogalacturonyl hydrolase YteR [Halalkalibacter krulwichiae]
MTNQTVINGKSALEWAKKASESLMKQYEPIMLPPANRWHYHQGVFLCGLHSVWQETNNQDYIQYFKEYVDKLVDENGNFYFERDQLDAIQPGLLLLPLYQHTGEERYKVAATKLRNLLNTINITSEGGFWHKDKYPYQMWLDGLYMAGPFTLQYGQQFNEPELIDLVLHQEALMRKNTKDHRTGLYFHGWDESGKTPWSVPETHTAPEIWGRSLGWYGLAVVDLISLLPDQHPKKSELIEVLQNLVGNLIRYQDAESGLWYQVIDKGHLEDNWLESSCSSLFVYTIAKAVRLGYIDDKYYENAKKGFEGIITHAIKLDEHDNVILTGICIGTSIGVYDYYVERETSENDLHGVGAFILASMQMYQLEKK